MDRPGAPPVDQAGVADRPGGPPVGVDLFATCPPLAKGRERGYARQIIQVAEWSERAGMRGILVYTDNAQADPWLVAQIIAQSTKTLCPLVAVQPVYMHPYTVAKMVASLGMLYQRRVYLNLVAGGFKNDLAGLSDRTPHDKRYQRLAEYALIVKGLCAGGAPVTHAGEFYEVEKLTLAPPLPRELLPGLFISGSSDAGLEAAKAIGAVAIRYPKPARDYSSDSPADSLQLGIRVGVIARADEATAWAVARARFPEDRRGQLTHQLAMKVSDSHWHKQLAEEDGAEATGPYWLAPFRNYQTMCPYLVGSHDQVAAELVEYMAVGYRTVIVDVPPDPEDLEHVRTAFDRAVELVRCQSYCKSG